MTESTHENSPERDNAALAPARRFWTSERHGTKSWHGRVKVGRRLAFEYHVHRHRGGLPDRWVFQPVLIFDRGWHRGT